MGHLPGLFTALCLQCYYIYFSWRRVTCAPHLSSGLWIEPCKPGLETLWTGLLRSGPSFPSFRRLLPRTAGWEKAWREWGSLSLQLELWPACLLLSAARHVLQAAAPMQCLLICRSGSSMIHYFVHSSKLHRVSVLCQALC